MIFHFYSRYFTNEGFVTILDCCYFYHILFKCSLVFRLTFTMIYILLDVANVMYIWSCIFLYYRISDSFVYKTKGTTQAHKMNEYYSHLSFLFIIFQ